MVRPRERAGLGADAIKEGIEIGGVEEIRAFLLPVFRYFRLFNVKLLFRG